ncbi:MAG: hypothetical protein KZQ66_02130 [Candidatus Thiodiazotropha sp. (ex Lucinoma aequizonata)]|nr:hypothetical protein [Candidatus Thiodiazotropha sp. (ex Lucinoma aequizonata)]MCU7896807.1 hypothetical protein [Candidatus Thiodiazotropha sp. (ex Lucinoma aequizonata)]MCU7900953.1 hypothetical protein [Candidatus Thiodiazotropha sp. (ex Lucinoma aequizonata)]
MTAYCAPTVLRTSRFRIALPQQAARALLHHDYRNDSTASRMRSLYALHRSLSVVIPAIQPRLRLSGTNRLRSAFHGGQRRLLDPAPSAIRAQADDRYAPHLLCRSLSGAPNVQPTVPVARPPLPARSTALRRFSATPLTDR